MIGQYYEWLHGKWPAGTVEKLPTVGEDGATNVPGVRIVGDLSGVPLLKFSSETGSNAIHAILKEPDFSGERRGGEDDVIDVVIIGAGVSGISAAMEAKKAGLSYILFEASEAFSTVVNFPKKKPIFTYPTDMTPSGGIQYHGADVKESLLEEMRQQVEEAGVEITRGRITQIDRKSGLLHLQHAGKEGDVTKARRVIVAIGRSGNFRKLGVPGEELDKVSNRLHDPKEFAGQEVLVVGGGDSALEAAIALVACGARVTLSYRKPDLTRPKPENVEQIHKLSIDPCTPVKISQPSSDRVTTAASSDMRGDKAPGCLNLALGTQVASIDANEVVLKNKDGDEQTFPNDAVFAMIGREPPLDFFRRSGVAITGDRNTKWWVTFAASFVAFFFLYLWTKGDPNLDSAGVGSWSFPGSMDQWISGLSSWWQSQVDQRTLVGTIAVSMKSRSFYYTLSYCLLVLIFGIRRIRRRRTPYVTRQTLTLTLIQWLPLFILPEIIFPWMGYQGWFAYGGFADQVFEPYIGEAAYAAGEWPEWGHPRAYWRAYGFILAWPLFVYNAFTSSPMTFWLIIGLIQTFVIIPWAVMRWGKGAYCGWICSCGALAETVGDAHRHKMPHGPKWTRLNMVGQVFLVAALLLLVLRIIGWTISGDDFADRAFTAMFDYKVSDGANYLSYGYIVDILFAGTLGVAFYFHLSGRVWCRFACPLAALMHIYHRLGKFRIFADKKKCISCNVCTSVCHQGIDIMNFANKGMPMEDPECVRCSACVQQCPTGVLQFGRFEKDGDIKLDTLPASRVQMSETAKR